MKSKLFVLLLTLSLSLVGWAQDAPTTSPAPNSPAAQTQGCCHHDAAMKDGKSCCHHGAADSKDAAACCSKDRGEAKDRKSCCEGKDVKAAMKECTKNGYSKDGKSCGEAKGDKTAINCCGGSQCEYPAQTQAAS